MKLVKICLILLMTFSSVKLSACDVCGCSMGGTTMGILPQFHKNFVGLHYYYRDFASEHVSLLTNEKTVSIEKFQTYELRGRFHLGKRIQLFVLAPVHVNQQLENNVLSKFNGIGDVSSFANYSIFNNADSLKSKWKHNLQAGGGIKLPTGKYKRLDQNQILNPNIQTGTGSFDLILDAIYTVRLNKFGLNNTAFYRINTTNSNDFKFGDRFTLTSSLFYWAKIKDHSLLPSLGVNIDHAKSDVHNSFRVDDSGGASVFMTAGIDFYIKKIMLAANFQLPMYQDSPITQSKLKFGATFLYNF
jgi:hypothetical protein